MAAIPAGPLDASSPVAAAPAQVVTATSLIGAPVYTRDGHRLGTVKEATADCFLVDVRLAFDYWLSSRAIAAVAAGRVQLGIDKREVGAYLVDPDCLQDFTQLPQ